MTGDRYLWPGPRTYLELDPLKRPAHMYRVRPRTPTEQDQENYT
jgi:starch synthase (maltosyl-transferring)